MAQVSLNDGNQPVRHEDAEKVAKENQHAESRTAEASPSSATERDMALEYDSMVLLSKLEQFGIRLGEKTVQASKTLALEQLVDLTNHVVEFSTCLPMTKTRRLTLEAVISKDMKSYSQLRRQYIKNDRLALDTLVDQQQDVIMEPNTFQGLSNDLLRVVNVYLHVFVMAFDSPRMSEQWRMVYKGFYVNVAKSIQEIQTKQDA